ncbi:MAG: type I glutamate--ammonia ligase [Anaerolineae bacterium]|nr:type I glutamate--ammonia ligase [Anaerolineae bacterium]MBN8619220.1 type I glutamate--ammonia ligase [Anaerolineae bacterium]
MPTKEAVLAAISEQNIQFVDLWFTDITGIVKSVTIPGSDVGHVIDHGSHFDGSSIEGFARVAESDMLLMPDINTFTVLPWNETHRTARLICNVYTLRGEPFIGDPRNILIKALRQAEEMGFSYKIGMELEFFLFRMREGRAVQPLAPLDQTGYFDISNDPAKSILQEMIASLTELNIQIDSTHHEIGAGQHEIDFEYDHALASADKILTARVALKTIANRHQLHCTFMPRPDAHLPGSGMHTHQSLHDPHSDANVFADNQDEYGLSQTAKYFLAGQLMHARAMCAILAPLVNSYKRLGMSFEAPMYVTWAHINRGALIRVPHIASGKEAHTRLELRCPDPSINPYLASAVMLMAGLDGIRQQLPLPDPLEETLVRQDRTRVRQLEILPSSLGEALDVLSQSDVILSALGPYISDRYLAAKRQEFEEYNRQVTAWELERYFNRY